eukprot:TRINITY_DN6841_c0_g1_i1.p1 TRINITY_DN6841_c0_g1~~TRINITY_DN6841_c0_g1_i1.p1  ORF type:complete len:525 (+),score=163.48 TRINITY_DN6841_c0_g1_i1:103-1677(+)
MMRVCALALLAAMPGDAVLMKFKQGIALGDINPSNDVAAFRGVPYAEPPVGELRWQPPVEKGHWKGIRQAITYSASCEQSRNPFSYTSKVSEDCLYLNVWMPQRGSILGAPKAVMIFFYGGSWETGSAMFPLYRGEALAEVRNDTIVVAANYRLNVFGFLGGKALRANDGSTGNFGLQDQRMVMQWVRDNAKFLNADVDRIMIFGESAGAGSVSAHLVAPRSRGLFTRAAMESGPFADWTTQPLKFAEKRLEEFTANAGCSNSDDIAACLRKLNVTEVAAANHHLWDRGLTSWSPVVDGVEIMDRADNIARRGGAANVPVLLGTNMNEGSTFCSLKDDANDTELAAYVDKMMAPNGTQVLAQYPTSAYKATKFASASWWTASAMGGDAEMTCAARRTARLLPGPSFVYFFKHKFALTDAIEAVSKKPLGVFHGSELVLVFGQDELLLKKEREMSMQVRKYWTNFAATGNPNGNSDDSTAPFWPTYTNSSDSTMIIDLEFGAVTGLKKELCDFWDTMPQRDELHF